MNMLHTTVFHQTMVAERANFSLTEIRPGHSLGHGSVIEWKKRDGEKNLDGKKSELSSVFNQSRSTDATFRENAQAHGQPRAPSGVAPDLLRAPRRTRLLNGQRSVPYGWSSPRSWRASSLKK